MVTRRSILVGAAGLPFCAALLTSKSRAQAVSSQFDYYISPAGSDSNAGTQSSPWAITSLTLGSANYSKIASHRIGLLAGKYDISTFAPSAYTTKLTIPAGVSGAPTVIQSVTPLAAVIVSDPGTSGYQAGVAIGNGANGTGSTGTPQYITIDGLTIVGGTTAPSKGMSGVSFAGSAPETCYGLVVQNCEIYNFLNPSGAVNIGLVTFGTGPIGAVVRNCKLHDCYTVGVARNQHSNSSGVHDYSNGVIVENCTIFGCNNGIYQKNQNATPPPDGMTVRNNYFYAGAGMNIALAGFNNAFGTTPPYKPLSVYNNVFEDVLIYGDDNDGVDGIQSNVYFYNNTIYNPSGVGMGGWIPTAAAYAAGVKTSMYNNILVGNTVDPARGAVTLGPVYGAWAVCDYNCYPTNATFGLSTASSTYPTSLISLALWRAVAGSPDVHSLTGNPDFVGSIVAGGGAQQYQLASSSPCKNAGRVGGLSTGAAVDMGAWGGTGSIGCDFGPVPDPPALSVS